MKLFTLTVALLALLVSGCGHSSSQVKLTSGKAVPVLGVGVVVFSQDTPALMVQYQTTLSIDETNALRTEAIEVWNAFASSAEKARLKNGLVVVTEKPKGFILTHNRGYRFVFHKADDGTWKNQ